MSTHTISINSDQASNEDLLNRRKFAEEISSNISNHFATSSQSLVIGIHGPWGSGKSTLLNFVKDEIKKLESYQKAQAPKGGFWSKLFSKSKNTAEAKLFILEFNPWMFSGKQQLHGIFLNELALKIKSEKQKHRSKLKKLARGLSWVGGLGGIGDVGNPIEQFAEISIEDLKAETNNLLEKEQIQVLIIMDDIDRLAPIEIIEIFQLIKLNANFSNTIFLISFDKSAVISSINEHYKLDGEKYLEKIVQVDYILPSILSEDMEAMFFKSLNATIDNLQIKFTVGDLTTPWLIVGLKFYFNNIRDINRYFNSINFRLPTIHEEVNIHDFLILEAMRLFDYKSYEIIKDSYKAAQQLGEKSYFSKRMAKLRKESVGLFDHLFTSNSYILTESQYRLRDLEFFDRYFSLSIAKTDMREKELREFLNFPSTRTNLLINIIRNKKVDFLLRRLSANPTQFQNVDSLEITASLIHVWDDFQNEFTESWREVWTVIKIIIVSHSDGHAATRNLIKELISSKSYFSPAQFVFIWTLLDAVRVKQGEIHSDLYPYMDLIKSKRNELENYFKLMLENHRYSFLYNNNYHNLYKRIFLPSLASYQPEIYNNEFKNLIKDDRSIFNVIDIFVLRDTATKVAFSIDTKYIDVLLKGELYSEFVSRLKSYNLGTLSKVDAEAVQGLTAYFEKDEDPFRDNRNSMSS